MRRVWFRRKLKLSLEQHRKNRLVLQLWKFVRLLTWIAGRWKKLARRARFMVKFRGYVIAVINLKRFVLWSGRKGVRGGLRKWYKRTRKKKLKELNARGPSWELVRSLRECAERYL